VCLYEALNERVPPTSSTAVVHGDYRIDNVIFAAGDAGKIAAVIDWELAALGDPLADLGVLLMYWDPVCAPIFADGHTISANPSVPAAEVVAAWYAEASGSDLTHLDFYVAFGFFKLAVVSAGIHRRFVEGNTRGPGFETVGAAVEPMMRAGLARLER
jgi:aminoglycoside phosphotransferase (APT) family kinase protein